VHRADIFVTAQLSCKLSAATLNIYFIFKAFTNWVQNLHY